MGILDLPPGSAILSWPAANYIDPDTRGSGSVIGCLALAAMCGAVVVARFWARAVKSKNFGIDDWVIMLAMLPTLGLVANAYLAIKYYDFDRHIWDIKTATFPAMLKITFADEFLYTMASGLVKISILSYFLRFFSPYVSNSLRYLTYATMVFVFLHMIIFTEELFLNCVPFSQTFMVVTADQNRQCVAGGVWGGVRNVSALVQDFIPAVLAVLMAWQMEVHRHQKIGVLVTLALAFGVCFVGIVRVGYFSSIYFTAFDWSWLGGQAFTWSAVECLLGIICASLPALSVFIYGVPPPMPAASEKDPMWRKFSMNESGRNGANNKGVFVHQKEVGSTDSLATSRNPNGYGGRRRSRVASMAPVVGEKEW